MQHDPNKVVVDGMLARTHWGQYPDAEVHMVRATYLSIGRETSGCLTDTLWRYWQNPFEEEQTDAV